MGNLFQEFINMLSALQMTMKAAPIATVAVIFVMGLLAFALHKTQKKDLKEPKPEKARRRYTTRIDALISLVKLLWACGMFLFSLIFRREQRKRLKEQAAEKRLKEQATEKRNNNSVRRTPTFWQRKIIRKAVMTLSTVLAVCAVLALNLLFDDNINDPSADQVKIMPLPDSVTLVPKRVTLVPINKAPETPKIFLLE